MQIRSSISRRQTPTVTIGTVALGSNHPVTIQAMTNTPTTDSAATFAQTIELINAGAELVRWTINDDAAAETAVVTIKRLRESGYQTPIIGDFHFNGHELLQRHPACAQALSKYRINPGNIGRGEKHDTHFSDIIRIAIDNNKPVRIGVNWGSLDPDLFESLKKQNAQLSTPKSEKEIIYDAMIHSALTSAVHAQKIGLPKDKIVLSVKMSHVKDMVAVYERLAESCDYALHVGLTEAGSDIEGITASAAALGILLQKGIGDTIRVSLTPQPNVTRSREVEVCKALLQALGLRSFSPTVTSCPGCGRTDTARFQALADEVKLYVKAQTPLWLKKYPGIETLHIAVMGCVVNGPGESVHADIGISLPGKGEKPLAVVYTNGAKTATLRGETIARDFIVLLEKYISTSKIKT